MKEAVGLAREYHDTPHITCTCLVYNLGNCHLYNMLKCS